MTPVRRSPSSYLILGMLRLGAATGYGIKRGVDRSTRFFFATSYAQVYPELARLARQKLVTRREEPRGARPRSVYALTPKGEEELVAWLRSTDEAPPQIRVEGALRLFLADALPERAEQVALVRRMARQADRVATHIRGDIVPVGEALAQDGPRFPAITARFGADVWAFAAEWLAREADALEREG
jgi:DNA-binding PadR family transcriptional regulator